MLLFQCHVFLKSTIIWGKSNSYNYNIFKSTGYSFLCAFYLHVDIYREFIVLSQREADTICVEVGVGSSLKVSLVLLLFETQINDFKNW